MCKAVYNAELKNKKGRKLKKRERELAQRQTETESLLGIALQSRLPIFAHQRLMTVTIKTCF